MVGSHRLVVLVARSQNVAVAGRRTHDGGHAQVAARNLGVPEEVDTGRGGDGGGGGGGWAVAVVRRNSHKLTLSRGGHRIDHLCRSKGPYSNPLVAGSWQAKPLELP